MEEVNTADGEMKLLSGVCSRGGSDERTHLRESAPVDREQRGLSPHAAPWGLVRCAVGKQSDK